MRSLRHLALRGLLLALPFAACESTTDPDPSPPPPELTATVLLSARDSTIAVYRSVQLDVRLLGADGTERTDRTVVLSTSDPNVAVVSPSGLVTGRGTGSAIITARSDTASATFPVNVKQYECAVSLPARMPVGAVRTASLSVGGRIVRSTNPAVATVSESGVVTAIAPGVTELRSECADRAPSWFSLEVKSGYTAIFLGALGGTDSRPWDLNDRGEVVGEAATASGAIHAFLWRDGRMADLGAPGRTSRALGISSNGLVVGAFTADPAGYGTEYRHWTSVPTMESGYRPFLWSGGQVTELDPGAEEENVVASAVNAEGVVVGYAETASGGIVVGSAVAWTKGPRTDYGRLGGISSRFVRINDAGEMLADRRASGPEYTSHSSLVIAGERRTEQPFQATGLADDGTVCGGGRVGSVEGRTSYMRESTGEAEIVVGRHSSAYAADVNGTGIVVGSVTGNGTTIYAFLWDRKAVIPLADLVLDLPAGWLLRNATGINERGEIIVTAWQGSTGRTGAVLLRPQQ
jgi:probable HAF family extracellular repeat protein